MPKVKHTLKFSSCSHPQMIHSVTNMLAHACLLILGMYCVHPLVATHILGLVQTFCHELIILKNLYECTFQQLTAIF